MKTNWILRWACLFFSVGLSLNLLAQETTAQLAISELSTNTVTVVQFPQESTEVVEYQEGEDVILRMRAGRSKVLNLVVERPLNGSDSSWRTWRQEIIQGTSNRRTLLLTFPEQSGESSYPFAAGSPVLECQESWPYRYEIRRGLSGQLVERISFAAEILQTRFTESAP